MNETKTELIKIISAASDRYGDKLIDFMDKYDLQNLAQATADQLKKYIENYLYEKNQTL